MTQPTYAQAFKTLYDESAPIGTIGRGTHYSVLRAHEWHDVLLQPTTVAQVHDFAVIWDEDHDVRVISAIEAFYIKGLLAPIKFIGERKGALTVILSSDFYWHAKAPGLDDYRAKLQATLDSLKLGDYWPVEIGLFSNNPENRQYSRSRAIINDSIDRVDIYLNNIDMLHALGNTEAKPTRLPVEIPSVANLPGY
jgi:hypothetical protein